MKKRDASDLSRRLAREAEAVCRHYLSEGSRSGRYWLVGDVANAPGRSLYVRLSGPDSGPGAAGKWTDAASGTHGDLLDLIAANRGLDQLRDVLDEARAFLGLPRAAPDELRPRPSAPRGSPDSARRLFAASKPIAGTLAELYLRRRGLVGVRSLSALRFHPRCYHRPRETGPTETWPALIAAATDLGGAITAVQRTYLNPALNSGEARELPDHGKAPIETSRRALGQLLGHGVRFGAAGEIMTAGEGIETMLSLRALMPTMASIAALTANHLAAIVFPPTLRRIYIARDRDAAGAAATEVLTVRADAAGIDAQTLTPALGDFNDDLRKCGAEALRSLLKDQLAPADSGRFLAQARAPTS